LIASPRTIRKVQSLQVKNNFLRRFIVKYANITKGFMHLLKKDTHFIWDEQAQESFDALNKALVSMPLLKSLDYSRDYLLYVTASKEMIGMVFDIDPQPLGRDPLTGSLSSHQFMSRSNSFDSCRNRCSQ
jgi:hypothetical protein